MCAVIFSYLCSVVVVLLDYVGGSNPTEKLVPFIVCLFLSVYLFVFPFKFQVSPNL